MVKGLHEVLDDAPSARGTDQVDFSERKAELASLGGIAAALGAASCCVIPFVLFLLGISGAWISNLTALEPYQPIFAAIAFGFLGGGFYLVYRKPRVAYAEGSYCTA